ncbi:MAG: thiazole synthase [Victivallaceae bacterium]|nr:thiazole synthase [Victivallaceae bacterium]
MKALKIADTEFKSRLFLGTGKFSSSEALKRAIAASKTELVTVSLTRVDFENNEDDILSAIDSSKVKIMLNTSGARDAEEAIRIAEFGRAAGNNWIKLEIHPDPTYLLPDPIETLKAAEILVNKGFIVLPYINADPVLAKRLEDVGVHTVMPLGAPIGSNQGLKTETMLRIIIEQSTIPVIIDAGIGLPSHAAAAIELGADAVLVNTAIASADNPENMAAAFAMAVRSAELGIDSGPASASLTASSTSPRNTFKDLF